MHHRRCIERQCHGDSFAAGSSQPSSGPSRRTAPTASVGATSGTAHCARAKRLQVRTRYLFRDIGLNAAPWAALWPADIIRAFGLPMFTCRPDYPANRIALFRNPLASLSVNRPFNLRVDVNRRAGLFTSLFSKSHILMFGWGHPSAPVCTNVSSFARSGGQGRALARPLWACP
jgi:hypothetical protein